MAWADSFLRTLKENDVRLVTYVPEISMFLPNLLGSGGS